MKWVKNMLNQASAIPLYIQIKELLGQQIKDRKYLPGELIPSEGELMQTFGVSRVTIRAAVSELVDEGVLQKKQGKGTFVLTPKMQTSVSELGGFTALCRTHGMVPSSHILCAKTILASERDVRLLGVSRGSEVVYIHRVCYADGLPVMIEHSFFPMTFAGLLEEHLENESLFSILSERYGIYLNPDNPVCFELALEVASATDAEAELLNIKRGQPLFLMRERVCTETGMPIQRSKQLLVGDGFKFTFRSHNSVPQLELI